jgi:hypothetical protein
MAVWHTQHTEKQCNHNLMTVTGFGWTSKKKVVVIFGYFSSIYQPGLRKTTTDLIRGSLS